MHSHLFKAPLSGLQEVSGFGDNGEGDSGDNWKVMCSDSSKYWERGSDVYFQHIDTGKYLHTSSSFRFNGQNCGAGCPILDQTEVCGSSKKDSKARWFTGTGVYIVSPEFSAKREEENEL